MQQQIQIGRLLRLPELRVRCGGISRSQVYKLIAQGELPAARKLGQSSISVWDAAEVDVAIGKMLRPSKEPA